MKISRYLLNPLRDERRRRRPRRSPPGMSPGTLRPQPEAPKPRVTLLAYGPDHLVEAEVTDLDSLREIRGSAPVVWVNVDGVEHVDTVRRLGEIFGLHRLALEDVVNVPQRAKVEDYGDYLFIVARIAMAERGLETEQIGIFLGSDFVLTFQEYTGDPLEPVRERIRRKIGRIRGVGADYLAYAVLDTIIDHYFPVLEKVGDTLEELEDEILGSPDRQTMGRLHVAKRELNGLRRAIWPGRDALNTLLRDSFPMIEDETRVYLRDCYDHVVQTIDIVESYRELTSSLTDLYLSTLSNRTNDIVKVLTLFSVLFIPLTFIAGIYGMNFDSNASPYNMPELRWVWGYPFALALMGAVAAGMLVFFRRRGWLGERKHEG